MRYHVDGWTGRSGERWPGALFDEAGLTFDEGLTDPNFAAKWKDVAAQLQSEGASSVKTIAAQESFTNEFTGLISGSFGLDPSVAADKAKQFVVTGQTVLGAVNTVTGLVSDIASATPQAIAQGFTGTLVALAVSTGTVSAGIGSAIVGAVAMGIDLLGKAGLLGPPPGIALKGCPQVQVNSQPDIVAGCVPGWSSAAVVSPGSPNWRSFPVFGNLADRGWYTPNGLGVWKDVTWNPPLDAGGATLGGATLRPIDWAFPNYSWVERGATPQSFLEVGFGPSMGPAQSGSDFQKAFASAWKSNAEYALNGLNVQDDAQVLLHVIRFWNRAHGAPAVAITQGGQGSYLESLVTRAINQVTSGEVQLTTDAKGIYINTGPRAAPARIINLRGFTNLARASAPSASATGAGKAVAIGAAALGALALTKPAMLRSILGKLGLRL